MKQCIYIDVETTQLDESIVKAERLVNLLTEAEQLLASICSKPNDDYLKSNECIRIRGNKCGRNENGVFHCECGKCTSIKP